jgi:hypothetical protein
MTLVICPSCRDREFDPSVTPFCPDCNTLYIKSLPPPEKKPLPDNTNIVGVCGKCGGRIVSPIVWTYGLGTKTPEWCLDCGAKPKKKAMEDSGPVREMED